MQNNKSVISWEEFNKYLKVGISIYAFTFVKLAGVEDNNAEIWYYRSFEEYKKAHPESKVPPEAYNGHFGDMENVEKILTREPARLMKNIPQLRSVKLYAPCNNIYFVVSISREKAEEFFGVNLTGLALGNNRWIKFVDRNALDPVKRKSFLEKFVFKLETV